MTPKTQQLIIKALGIVAVACIAAEVVLSYSGSEASSAVMTIAASCVGGIAGIATSDYINDRPS